MYLLVDLVGLPWSEVLFGRGGGDIGHGVEVAAGQVEFPPTPSVASIRITQALFRLVATAAAKPPGLPAPIMLISQDLVCMGY